MIILTRYQAYMEARWKPWRKPARADDWHLHSLMPVPAKTAWAWVKANEIRQITNRLAPLPEPAFASFSDAEEHYFAGDVKILVRRKHSDMDVLDGVARIDRQTLREREYGVCRNSRRYIARHGRVNVIIPDYSEDERTDVAHKAGHSRGLARFVGILGRRIEVAWVDRVLCGDISFTDFNIQVSGFPDMEVWGGPFSDEESVDLRNEIEDALRSVLRQISELKAAP